MPKSTHRKKHQEKLLEYKANKKKEQDVFKKKMMDHYMKMQQDSLASREDHTSTEDVFGPEINIDELNDMVDFHDDNLILDEPIIDIIDVETEIYDDNNN
jgi:hypothetical protein